jgi:NAD(P)-dependent dehydrogenase (short-subunit alcohol dehydrogenase family)
MAQFSEKVVLITGGGSGMGRATALAFTKQGAKVVIANRRANEGQQTVQLVQQTGGEGIFVQTDVTQEADVAALIQRAIQVYGRLDYAFNNAGMEQTPKPLIEQREEEYTRLMDVNVKGVWLCMKYEIPQMLQTGGAIVNTSSISGVVGFATIPLYSASKHAVIGLTKCVALEYAKHGIRVNAICPGAISDTGTFERSFGGNEQAVEQTRSTYPLGRLGTVEEIAETVMYLCSDAAGFTTGQALVLDGGYAVG